MIEMFLKLVETIYTSPVAAAAGVASWVVLTIVVLPLLGLIGISGWALYEQLAKLYRCARVAWGGRDV